MIWSWPSLITVVLLCVAADMKFYRYSPTTGEISMSGRVGTLTSATHPILGGLLHYTPGVFPIPNESLEDMGMHLRVVN